MTTTTESLSAKIGISHKFQRSANVAADAGKSSAGKDFVLYGSNMACLETVARFLADTDQRAFTWTGSFGTGKSSLALFLTALLGGDDDTRKACADYLKESAGKAADNFKALTDTPKWDILTITGKNGSLSQDFVSLVTSNDGSIDNHRAAIEALVEHSRKTPTILVIDELGKYLEKGDTDNCYFLQELAEAVNRSQTQMLVIGILHQSFEAYAKGLSQVQRDEWSKVQGRYVDIPLLTAPSETLRLLGRCIERKDLESDARVLEVAKEAVSLLKSVSAQESQAEDLAKVWPLNPVTAILLGPLSRRHFLQNTRSVFNFLTSKEPFGFSAFLEQTPVTDDLVFYGLDCLWDYLRCNFEQAILAGQSESHRWLIAGECVDRTERILGEPYLKTVKALAVLDLFKRGTGLETTAQTLALALSPMPLAEVKKTLAVLVDKKIVIERKFSDSYALFEGSDFNLDEALKAVLSKHDPLDNTLLQGQLALPAVVARRHYAQTGTLRWFSCEVVTLEGFENHLAETQPKAGATGRLILCLPDLSDIFVDTQIDNVEWILANNGDQSVYAGIPQNAETIYESAKELQALTTVLKDPSLEGDATARREIYGRIAWVSDRLKREINRAFNTTRWIDAKGESVVTHSYGEVVKLVSDVCDRVYCAAPKMVNELINREQLSSNITSARRRLIEAMVEHDSEERLGLTGFPPQAMIYASLIEGQIHRFDKDKNEWRFMRPNKDDGDSRYADLWEATDAFFKSNAQPKLSDLYAMWKQPPFGLKSGVMPLLAMAYVLTETDRLSVYLDGVFQPELNREFLDRWTIDAKNISFKYVELTQDVSDLLQALATGLSVQGERPTAPVALQIARAIVKEVLSCPRWALATTQLTDKTRRFRDATVKAWDPLKLIFEDLPEVFETKDAATIAESVLEALREIRNVTPKMIEHIREELYRALDSDGDLAELSRRAQTVKCESMTIQMKSFVSRVASLEKAKATDAVIEGFVSLAVSKPKTGWTDRDIEEAVAKIRAWGFEFRHLEGMAAVHEGASARRMVSIAVAGKKGAEGRIVNVPAKMPAKLQKDAEKLQALLAQYAREEALLLLIEATAEVLKKDS